MPLRPPSNPTDPSKRYGQHLRPVRPRRAGVIWPCWPNNQPAHRCPGVIITAYGRAGLDRMPVRPERQPSRAGAAPSLAAIVTKSARELASIFCITLPR